MPIIVCIGCGCTDSDPCPGGCSWIAGDEDLGAGLCSQCAAEPLKELIGRAVRLRSVRLAGRRSHHKRGPSIHRTPMGQTKQ